MNIFDFREKLITAYQDFSRSFAEIKAPDIYEKVNQAYKNEEFHPSPLMQINPDFKKRDSIGELVSRGVLEKECLEIFRLKNFSSLMERCVAIESRANSLLAWRDLFNGHLASTHFFSKPKINR